MAPVASSSSSVRNSPLASTPAYAIAIGGGALCCAWLLIFVSQHLYFRLRCSRARIGLVGVCCVLAVSGWVLFILAAWLTTVDQLALRYGCMGLVVAATWILVCSVISFVLLLRVKSDSNSIEREPHLRNADSVRVPVARASTETAMEHRSFIDTESLVEQVDVTEEDDETCAICLEPMCESSNSLSVVRPLKCPQHHFHKQCIVQWLARSEEPACPICKRPCT